MNITGVQLRALLKSQGMTEEELSQIDDATLEKLYQEGIRKKTP